jgi:hypothetical protein
MSNAESKGPRTPSESPCVHIDKRCASWAECAPRSAKTSGRRAQEVIDHSKEVARLRKALEWIANAADDAEDAKALLDIMREARRALSDAPIHVIPYPPEGV